MKSLLFFIAFILIGIYILSNCANIKPPTGGPRDTIPPILIKSIPDNKSLNFEGTSVRLFYDEHLKIENLNKQLIITPLIDSEFESKIKKNSIELTFPQSFTDSTTFTFNFQNAIQDITEGNVTYDNVLAFSTGNFIDSIYITGKVKNLFTNQPAEEYTVCLYEADDTLDIFNSKPIYLTRSDEFGKFRIENIKNGYYKIYTYFDSNSNLFCDIPKEPFGFFSDTLNLNQYIDSVFLDVFYLDMRPVKIQRSGPSGQYYEVKLNKNINDYTIKTNDSSHVLYHNFGGDRKTIRFYNTFQDIDSLQFFLSAYDSINNVLYDTLYLKFTESKRKKEDFNYSFSPKDAEKITDNFNGKITFSKPIKSIIADSVYFKYDSVTYQFIPYDSLHSINDRDDTFAFSIKLFFNEYIEDKLRSLDTVVQIPENKSRGGAGINTGKKRQTDLNLHFGRGSFTSVENDTLRDLDYYYTQLRSENFGIIRGKVFTSFSSFTIQLLDKQGLEIQQEIKNTSEYSFNNVKPGSYVIRVFIDTNNDGKWDPGNIYDNIKPEEVYFFPEVISVRANWEITDINLEF